MSAPRGLPFAPGNTAGRGRPPGSGNKTRGEGEDLIKKYTPQIVTKCIHSALRDNASAMRLCMERVVPSRRDALARIKLPRIRAAEDVSKAAEKVMRAIAHGEITPAEGERMMNALECQLRIIREVELQSRLERAEADLANMPVAA